MGSQLSPQNLALQKLFAVRLPHTYTKDNVQYSDVVAIVGKMEIVVKVVAVVVVGSTSSSNGGGSVVVVEVAVVVVMVAAVVVTEYS